MIRNLKKQTALVCCILAFALSTGDLFSQMKKISLPNVHSEGNFYDKNGTLYVDAVVINFKDHVIDLSQGVRYAEVSDILPGFTAVTQIIKDFDKEFGPIKIIK
jgi:hypothetical protein